MKFIKTSIIIIAIMFLSNIQKAVAQDEIKNKIDLSITDIKSVKGNLLIALTTDQGVSVQSKCITVDSENLIVIFNDIDKGKYAISMFHDENANDTLDINSFGIPNEGYAFSNNVWARFGPPHLKNRLFNVNQDVSITIKME